MERRNGRAFKSIPVSLLVSSILLACASFAAADELNGTESENLTLVSPDELLDSLSLPKKLTVASNRDDIDLPEAEPAFIAFAKECASLDAIPLLNLKQEEGRRVFVGINFDGVLGIHGLLK